LAASHDARARFHTLIFANGRFGPRPNTSGSPPGVHDRQADVVAILVAGAEAAHEVREPGKLVEQRPILAVRDGLIHSAVERAGAGLEKEVRHVRDLAVGPSQVVQLA
jgi:hypothetical protein